MNHWITANASITGSSHAKSGQPCQDASHVAVSQDGKWLVAVLSDGAGSAARSKEGSDLTVNFFSNGMFTLCDELNTRQPGSWINDFVIQKILDLRQKLRDIGGTDNLKDFHCTLLAILLGERGGFAIHIGDGAIFGGKVSTVDHNKSWIQPDSFFCSGPENGEYSNETFFLTDGSWIKHLRITPLISLDWIFLGSDGATALALENEISPRLEFLEPAAAQIFSAKEKARRDEILSQILNDPRADKISSDDKSIIFAARESTISDLLRPIQKTIESATATKPKHELEAIPKNQKTKNPNLKNPIPNHIQQKEQAKTFAESKKKKSPKMKVTLLSVVILIIACFLFFVFVYPANNFFGVEIRKSLNDTLNVLTIFLK